MKPADFFPSAQLNSAITDTAGSFDPQLPLGRELVGTAAHTNGNEIVPPGILLLDDGRIRLNFAAKDAVSVTATAHRKEYVLEKGEDGIWTTEIDAGDGGFCPVMFFVDGAEVINPLAPIGFGASRPINYIDIPQQDGNFFAIQDVPHGAVVQDYYFSKATDCWKSCLVYTPPGYMKDDMRSYPVLYLQHGHGENEQCWIHQGKANFILDNLLADGKIEPMIVVMNNGMVQTVSDGYRKLDTAKIEALLLEDCIPYIESHYRVKTDKWSRAMAGLSMGSMQTSKVTLSHPDLFGYAGIFSGFVGSFGKMVGDADYMKELDDKEQFVKDFKVFFRANGDRDFVAMERFQADRAYFAERGLSPQDTPVHIEKIYSGEHEWNVWRRCLRDFAQLIFR